MWDKTNKVLLAAFLLILLTIACAADGGLVDRIRCGTLVKICNGVQEVIMVGARDLSQNVDDHTRFYRFYDCATNEQIKGSCGETCTVEIKY